MASAVVFATGHSEEFHAKDNSKPQFSLRNKNASQPISSQLGITAQSVNWGRRFQSHWAVSFASIGVMTLGPCFVIFTWIALEKFEASLLNAGLSLLSHDTFEFVVLNGPRFSLPAFTGHIAWFVFLAGLYSFLPGPLRTGQLTPAGHLLQ